MKTDVKKLVLSGVFLALGMVLPFLTMQVPHIGTMLLPMHIPVLLCGFVCGAPYGIIVGFITPLLRSIIFSAPKLFPMACGMAFELASYGFFTGFLYKLFKKQGEGSRIYLSLFLAMLGGRLVWAIAANFFYKLAGMEFTMEVFLAGGFINAVPGIILQLIIIPIIVLALKKAGVINE